MDFSEIQDTAMVNGCCRLLDADNILSNDFVAKVYSNPGRDQYNCASCNGPASEHLGIAILTTLLEQATTLEFSDLVKLRAAVWSLLGCYHGINQSTCFYVVDVRGSASGVVATVRTEHDQTRQLAISKADFLEMVEDPLFDREEEEEDVHTVWNDLAAPSNGSKAPRTDPAPMVLKEVPCWCCDKKVLKSVPAL